MTDNDKLARAKVILDITANTWDSLISGYITDAGYRILAITGQVTIPVALEHAQVDMAVQMYSKRGAEGESAHSEGGVSATYDGLSPGLQLLLRSYSLARVVDMNAEP